jgi:hypothetical protein
VVVSRWPVGSLSSTINCLTDMATLYKHISATFLAKLSDTKEFDENKIEQLRMLLGANKKLKAEDLVKVIAGVDADEIK